jgi:hypothetical protein
MKTVMNIKFNTMKKFGIVLILAAIILQAFSQEVISKEKTKEKQDSSLLMAGEKTKVVIGDNLISVEDGKGALKLRVGNRGLNILDSLEGSKKFRFEKYSDNATAYVQDDKQDKRRRNSSRFRGQWAGVEFGFNNYLTADNSFVMPSSIDYMTLHSSKSNCFNLNFAQQSIGITRHFGLVTGLGINWNNYRFDNNNNIEKGPLGVIQELPITDKLEKSKLTTVYLTLPVMAEIQIPVDNHHINIEAGLIGAVKIGSHTKMVYEGGDKVKSNDDFSLSMLRYGPTARIGFENLQVFATYYMTPLFKTGKSPGGYELHPFEIGLAFTFND